MEKYGGVWTCPKCEHANLDSFPSEEEIKQFKEKINKKTSIFNS